jgi:hypothetical protein
MKLFFKKSISLGRDKTALAGTFVEVPEALARQALNERSDAVFAFNPESEDQKAALSKSNSNK